jgi:uncharacterized protein YecT (DUF1311 family)
MASSCNGLETIPVRSALILFCLAFVAPRGVSPAHADAADPHDVAAISQCLKGNSAAKEPPENCIAAVASPCFKGDEAAASPGEIVQCFGREQSAWDQLLNDSFKRLHDHLDAGQQVKLRDMQRSWILARKQSCDFFADYFKGSMAYPMIASCMNRETARRAIFLDVFASDAAGGK